MNRFFQKFVVKKVTKKKERADFVFWCCRKSLAFSRLGSFVSSVLSVFLGKKVSGNPRRQKIWLALVFGACVTSRSSHKNSLFCVFGTEQRATHLRDTDT